MRDPGVRPYDKARTHPVRRRCRGRPSSSRECRQAGGESMRRAISGRVQQEREYTADMPVDVCICLHMVLGLRERGSLLVRFHVMRRKKPSAFIKCANCGHLLEIAVCSMYPKDDTPKEHIHRFLAPTETPGSFGCYLCGHFTQPVRSERDI